MPFFQHKSTAVMHVFAECLRKKHRFQNSGAQLLIRTKRRKQIASILATLHWCSVAFCSKINLNIFILT